MSRVELPPLAEAYYPADHDCGVEYPSWTADQVEEYGIACARAALEAAAREAERTYVKSATLFELGHAAARHIRALKVGGDFGQPRPGLGS